MASFWVTYEGTRFPVRRGETMIGRSAYCTIVVSDSSVSREHASLRLVDGVLLLTDLGSRNGTFVNGAVVQGTRPVAAGDSIVLGSAVLRIEATEEDRRSRRSTGNLLEGPEDPTTQSTTTTVELAHRLVEQLQATGASPKQLKLIRDVVDSVADAVGTGYKLRESDGPKLAGATAYVVQVTRDPEVEQWRTEVLRKLGIAE